MSAALDLEVNHRLIDYPAFEPAEAYARLRSYTPDRPSFLLESFGRDSPEGRHSLVGYRIRRAEDLPPGADAIRAWLESAAGIGAAPGRVRPSVSARLVMVEAVPMVMQ